MYKPRYQKKASVKTKRVMLIVLLCLVLATAIFMIIQGKMGEMSAEAVLPWESGGKQPVNYSWDEYLSVEGALKDSFFESFASSEEFDKGKNSVSTTEAPESTDVSLPWEKEGKQPQEYTWEEYQALDDSFKDAFFEAFGSVEAFDEWLAVVNGDTVKEEFAQADPTLPTEKRPEEYTWLEYESLTADEKDLFFESFDSPEAFGKWYNGANPQRPQMEILPEDQSETNLLDTANKPIEEYTWEEFEQLTPEQQEEFFLSFVSPDAFEAWMLQAQQQQGLE